MNGASPAVRPQVRSLASFPSASPSLYWPRPFLARPTASTGGWRGTETGSVVRSAHTLARSTLVDANHPTHQSDASATPHPRTPRIGLTAPLLRTPPYPFPLSPLAQGARRSGHYMCSWVENWRERLSEEAPYLRFGEEVHVQSLLPPSRYRTVNDPLSSRSTTSWAGKTSVAAEFTQTQIRPPGATRRSVLSTVCRVSNEQA
jgi:hypothetical protein